MTACLVPSRPLAVPAAVALATIFAIVLGGCSAGGGQQLPADSGDTGVVEHSDAPTVTAPDVIDVASLDACTVLPQADAETLIGTKLTEPLKAATADISSCTYPGDPSGPTAQVEVFVGSGVEKALEIDRDTLEHEFTQPAGLGDESWLEDGQLFTRSGENWISLRLTTLDDFSRFDEPIQSAMKVALFNLGLG